VNSLDVPVLSYIWPDDGSIEPKHVAECLILITNIQGVIKKFRDWVSENYTLLPMSKNI